MRNDRARIPVRLVLGLGVIVVGVVFTLDNLGLVDARDVLVYWPVLLIAVGLTRLGSSETQDLLFLGLWVGLGLWLLAYNLEYVDFSPWQLFWPAVLILLGVSLILGGLRRRGARVADDSTVNVFALLSGVDRKNTSERFQGGELTAIMGGGEVDLRQARISDPEALLNVFALWGGFEIKVPEEWLVESRVLPLLGGLEDTTRQPPQSDAPRLVIKGYAIMGGVEVHN